MPLPLPDAAEIDWLGLTQEPISVDELVAWATVARAGAVVSFLGVVRDHAEGRTDVMAMTYEAYDGPARERLAEIAAATRSRWPDLERIALVHRLGRLELSEVSVAVVVSSPHRAAAFDAGRYAIDTLKESVPIWKKEHWADGSDWGLGANEIKPIGRRAARDTHEVV